MIDNEGSHGGVETLADNFGTVPAEASTPSWYRLKPPLRQDTGWRNGGVEALAGSLGMAQATVFTPVFFLSLPIISYLFPIVKHLDFFFKVKL